MATVARTEEVEIVERVGPFHGYVDWAAIFAGAAVASAISIGLVAFGSALGLSLTYWTTRSSMPGVGIVVAIGLWLLWLQISASLGGGYVAGRLRRRLGDAPSHEVGIRDGMHGLVVWAIGVLIASLIAAWAATLGSMGAAAVGSAAVSNPSSVANVTDYYVDRLLRPEVAAGAAAPAAASQRQISPELRSEIGRLLLSGRVTAADSEDRAYLLGRLASETGMPEQAVAQRLDATLAAMKARADQARRLGVMMAFITAVSMLISAVAAWWAAIRGGDHRDQSVDHSSLFGWR